MDSVVDAPGDGVIHDHFLEFIDALHGFEGRAQIRGGLVRKEIFRDSQDSRMVGHLGKGLYSFFVAVRGYAFKFG